jgi:hypothetical protein
MSAQSLSDAFVANYKYNGWYAGVMFWQYSSDPNGYICSNSITALINLVGKSSPVNPVQNTTTNTTKTNNTASNSTSTNNTKNTTTSTNSTNNSTITNATTNSTKNTTISNNTTNSTNSNGKVPAIDYPVRFAYVNSISDWSSPQGIAKALGVPGYAPPHKYNYVCLTFWTSQSGPLDTAQLWNNSINYFGSSTFGSTSADIRTNIKKIFNDNGIKLMVSAFGSTENPTS